MINKYGVASSELTPLDCYTNHSSYLHSKMEQVELGNIKFIDCYRFLEAGKNDKLVREMTEGVSPSKWDRRSI